MNILIRNGTVVTPTKAIRADLLIEDDRIARIAKQIDATADQYIDATDLHIMAGFVDMHCHLREPGQEHKEDIQSGTRAALRGGFCTIAAMPNTSPPIDNAALVSFVCERARAADNAKVCVIGCISKGQRGQELAEFGMMKRAGAIAVSDDGHPVSDSNLMRRAMQYAADLDLLVISHCEDMSLVGSGIVNEGLNATTAGLPGISPVAEEAMIAREILLARSLRVPVHIAHVSTRGGVQMLRAARAQGIMVTAETCPHYFAATDDEILNFNTAAKINPPLRTDDDNQAIIEALLDGTIDCIATDHAPHHADEKNREFALAPNGTSGLETAFAVSYTHLVKSKVMDIVRLSHLMSARPAEILRLPDTGRLVEGALADITIVDLSAGYTVDSSTFESRGHNCVFDGWKLYGQVIETIVEGKRKNL